MTGTPNGAGCCRLNLAYKSFLETLMRGIGRPSRLVSESSSRNSPKGAEPTCLPGGYDDRGSDWDTGLRRNVVPRPGRRERKKAKWCTSNLNSLRSAKQLTPMDSRCSCRSCLAYTWQCALPMRLSLPTHRAFGLQAPRTRNRRGETGSALPGGQARERGCACRPK